MDDWVARRKRVERRLRLVGLLLLGFVAVGFVAWILLADYPCSGSDFASYCERQGRLSTQASDIIGLVLLGFAGITALWWGLVGAYRFRTEKKRLRSILASRLPSRLAPSSPNEETRTSPPVIPSWRPGLRAILVAAVLLAILMATIFTIAYIKDKQRPFNPYDYRRVWEATQLWQAFSLLLFLVSIGVIVRIVAIRRADIAHMVATHRAETLSVDEAYSILLPKESVVRVRQKAWRGVKGGVSRVLNWGPSMPSKHEPLTLLSTDDLKILYARTRTLRFRAFWLLLLSPLTLQIALSIYESARCVEFNLEGSRWGYCLRFDPKTVTTGVVVGIIGVLVLVEAVNLWWRALVLQRRTTILEDQLAQQERLREAAADDYPLGDPTTQENSKRGGARGGS